jgi:alpha-tubulin suppressor-like RCC1 family protein
MEASGFARPVRVHLISVLASAVAACGGGGGGGGNAPPDNPPANTAPTASFTATPTSGTAPLTVQFDAAGSSDTGGSISTYAWNFGDGSAAGSGVTTGHTFVTSGTFTVILTVTDNGGLTGTVNYQVAVSNASAATLPKIASIDTGDSNVCAVGVDGTAWCWGPNQYGQLGTGDTATAMVPRAAAEGYLFSKVSVSTGGAFSCGIATTGAAYCWGNQEGGRLGDGTMGASGSYVTSPVPVSGGHTFIDIAAGGDHACAVATGGAAYCWGHNEQGQLGTGSTTNSAVPVAVTGGLTFRSITTHQMVSCGITGDGTGYCWGYGDNHNLGNGSTSSTNAPTPISGGLHFSSLSLGLLSACGVEVSGDGYCWGSNGVGELGIGSFTPSESLVPVKVVDGHRWSVVSAGIFVTCGATTGDEGFGWGGNVFGERGTGSYPAPDVASPMPISGGLLFQSIDADWVSCGVASGIAYCWGPGAYGSIGDGTGEDRGVPTPAAGQ